MKLVVHELKSTITQEINSENTCNVVALRLHLYKHNSPAGSVYLEVQDALSNVVATSESILISSISASPFFHGKVRFNTVGQLKKNTQYSIILKSTGYTFDEAAYIGWCADFDFNTYDTDYVVNRPVDSPLDYEVWIKT